MGLQDFARVKAGILLSAIARQNGAAVPPLSLEDLDMNIAYPEAVEFAKSGNLFALQAQAGRILGRPYQRSLARRIVTKAKRLMRGGAR